VLTGEPVAAQWQCGQVERLSLGFEVGLQTLNLAVPIRPLALTLDRRSLAAAVAAAGREEGAGGAGGGPKPTRPHHPFRGR
jgi:hypothetical protein